MTYKGTVEEHYMDFPTGGVSHNTSLVGGLKHLFATQIHFHEPATGTGVNHIFYSWESRRHRKGREMTRAPVEGKEKRKIQWFGWAPRRWEYWTGMFFFIGSICFVFGGIPGVTPFTHPPHSHHARYKLYWNFVPSLAGATCFILGTFCQYVEVVTAPLEAHVVTFQEVEKGDANAPPPQLKQAEPRAQTSRLRKYLWQPRRIDWVAASIMFIGAWIFEANSINNVIPGTSSTQSLARRYVWSFSTAGAACFVVSGYLQVIEQTHKLFAFRPKSLSFWAVFLGFLGGVEFFIASLIGFSGVEKARWFGADLNFLIGSCFFLVSSYLLILEVFN